MSALTERAPKTSAGVARYGFLIIESNLIVHVKGICRFHTYLQFSVTFPDIQQVSAALKFWRSGYMLNNLCVCMLGQMLHQGK